MNALPTSETFYPPTVQPPDRALSLPRFFARFIRNPLQALPRSVYSEPIVAYGKKRPLVTWVTDPELIERILLRDVERFPKTPLDRRVLTPMLGNGILTAEGDSWRWQRKIASPMFRYAELLSYVPTMVEAAEQLLETWKPRGQKFTTDVEEAMTETTFSVIARTVLAGIDENEAGAVKRSARIYLDRISWEVAAAILHLPATMWHPGKANMRSSAREVRAIVQHLLAQCRKARGPNGDLVARMIAARHPTTGEQMSDTAIVDNLTTFLFAGHETTAKALTWTLYLLARSPQWQDRLRHEVQHAILSSQRVGPGTIERLPLTLRVLKEALRLYPPAPVMTRLAKEDTDLAGTHVSRGSLIVIPIFVLHRHRRLWDDPDRFDPDRFLPENEAKYPRTQFMPFGYGPRICVGSSFALIEATAILATLLQSARFEWDGRHVPEPISRVTLRPKGGMPLIVKAL
ncbi:cytochrome P450 [Hyphomicrobium denitrificans 1NES1]|uniref:Cytochrome P450 n=1 Tax=Hyphomicrobium denitrificans 1NES1 TaxID=670307 RepID=N0B8T3_9HYPH|nr:cytochrome P450 [Hyphomicrobium denitrificans]AGK58697.1 cytochrome P450 [Hyphomicrobium denitrificans 1NES1]